jgi:hypothetical protein
MTTADDIITPDWPGTWLVVLAVLALIAFIVMLMVI